MQKAKSEMNKQFTSRQQRVFKAFDTRRQSSLLHIAALRDKIKLDKTPLMFNL